MGSTATMGDTDLDEDPDFEAFFDYKELTNHKLALSYASSTTKSNKSKSKNKLEGAYFDAHEHTEYDSTDTVPS